MKRRVVITGMGASKSMLNAIITTMALKDSFMPATINYREADPDCDLNIIPNVGISYDATFALSNSLGFGGHNATIVFKKFN